MECGSNLLRGITMANLAETVKDLVQERSRMAGQIKKLARMPVYLECEL
jgi:hypothetical protein